jgi:hypothetical protein
MPSAKNRDLRAIAACDRGAQTQYRTHLSRTAAYDNAQTRQASGSKLSRVVFPLF